MKDGKKLKKVEKGPETQDISVRTSVCVPASPVVLKADETAVFFTGIPSSCYEC